MALYRTGGSSVKFKTGTFTTASSAVHVEVGFKPKYLAVITYQSNGTSLSLAYIYNEDLYTTKYMHTAGDKNLSLQNLNSSTAYYLKSIDDDGFTVNGYTTAGWRGNAYYFAIG